jgi:hypothetical protein
MFDVKDLARKSRAAFHDVAATVQLLHQWREDGRLAGLVIR